MYANWLLKVGWFADEGSVEILVWLRGYPVLLQRYYATSEQACEAVCNDGCWLSRCRPIIMTVRRYELGVMMKLLSLMASLSQSHCCRSVHLNEKLNDVWTSSEKK